MEKNEELLSYLPKMLECTLCNRLFHKNEIEIFNSQLIEILGDVKIRIETKCPKCGKNITINYDNRRLE